jgi:hypothetical protein
MRHLLRCTVFINYHAIVAHVVLNVVMPAINCAIGILQLRKAMTRRAGFANVFFLCRIAGEFIVFRCKYMYYFCSFNLFGLFFSLFSRQMCKLSSRNRFPNLLKMPRLRMNSLSEKRQVLYASMWIWSSNFRAR